VLAACALAGLSLAGCHRVEPLRVAAAGDVQLGDKLVASPFADGMLLDGDVRLVNLEGPLTKRQPRDPMLSMLGTYQPGRRQSPNSEPTFAFDPARATWLRDRVDVVSLANNHALDAGRDGREDTVRALDGVGVAATFEGRDASVTRRGRRVTVLARSFAPSADLDDSPEVMALIAAVADAPRPTIVSLHWGHTGMVLPDEEQKRLAHRLVDNGAVAVIGHGPHTMQGTERYHRGVIAYSLGNFAFGCDCTDVSDAYVLGFTIDAAGRARDVALTPIVAGLARPPRRAHDPDLRAQLLDLCADLSPRSIVVR
jgi:poly-gamma-glutamate synthesis protein (capsule biosynthesis protein)